MLLRARSGEKSAASVCREGEGNRTALRAARRAALLRVEVILAGLTRHALTRAGHADSLRI